jgi:hypothetical protein
MHALPVLLALVKLALQELATPAKLAIFFGLLLAGYQ